jgi:hypothetical protein
MFPRVSYVILRMNGLYHVQVQFSKNYGDEDGFNVDPVYQTFSRTELDSNPSRVAVKRNFPSSLREEVLKIIRHRPAAAQYWSPTARDNAPAWAA